MHTKLMGLLASLAATVSGVGMAAQPAPAHVQPAQVVSATQGAVTEIAHWKIQAEARVQQSGALISNTNFNTDDWYPVSGRATVMAGLLENGLYKNVFFSDNLRAVAVPDSNQHEFVVPWWYRTQFELPKDHAGTHMLLRTNGISGGADLWVNGHQVATDSETAGAYPVREFDLTKWLHAGANTLAMRVHNANPQLKLTSAWVDWNPLAPDNNMGPWRGVDLVATGPVELRFPDVTSDLSLPGLQRAALSVSVEVRNLDQAPREVVVAGEVAGVALRREVRLAAGAVQVVTFTPKTDAGLDIAHPRVWWPRGMGDHPLYNLELQASVDGAVSDKVSSTFGIRSVRAVLTGQGSFHGNRSVGSEATKGYLQFVVNGKPLLIRGAGWAPDMFMRHDPARMAAEFTYVENLGLNTIRLEGKLEDRHFYDLADRSGIMILPGWECCSKWEAAAKTGAEPWNANDWKVARASMVSEARLLRNHPSVIGFLIGSDNAPPPKLAKLYVDVLRSENWQTPIVAAASDQGTKVTGPSGMKMAGPYGWVPPNYWYANKLGGAFGFASEVSAGADIPRLEDVQRMLSPLEQEALWKYPDVRQYHSTSAWSPFGSLKLFDTALAKRYGAPKDLADYVAKAQLANYDNVRAQFEAYSAHMDAANPATGVVYWMLNNAWPSLHWHLYDYYMNPAGAYFGAQKANEPVHIQYAYDEHAIVLVNHTLTAEHGLQAQVRVRNLDGQVRYQKDLKGITLAGNHTQQLLVLPKLSGLTSTYFVELALADPAGQPISRNVYWLSTQPDALDWKKSNWYTTPLTQYANLTALQTLKAAPVAAHASSRADGQDTLTTVTLTVPAQAQGVAFFQHLSVRDAAGKSVVPILWSGNDVTLWPGESITLTARYRTPAGAAATVRLEGWNVAAKELAAAVATAGASSAPVTGGH